MAKKKKSLRNSSKIKSPSKKIAVERVQTGVRMEKRIVKVLKALAETYDITLGDLLEGIVLHAFEGKCALSSESQVRVERLKEVYGLDLDARASHCMFEDAEK